MSIKWQLTKGKFYIENINKTKVIVITHEEKTELEEILNEVMNSRSLCFVEIEVKAESRNNLGRPNIKPSENVRVYMDKIKE